MPGGEDHEGAPGCPARSLNVAASPSGPSRPPRARLHTLGHMRTDGRDWTETETVTLGDLPSSAGRACSAPGQGGPWEGGDRRLSLSRMTRATVSVSG